MTTISVYDTDEKRIEAICERFDMTEAEVIEFMLDVVDQEGEDFFQ